MRIVETNNYAKKHLCNYEYLTISSFTESPVWVEFHSQQVSETREKKMKQRNKEST